MIDHIPFLKKRQFLPGPTPIPCDDMIHFKNIMYHRSEEFSSLINENRKLLAKIFQSKNEPLIFTSSGTGAMESAVVNLTNESDSTLVISAGRFGRRWHELLRAYNCQIEILEVSPLEEFDINTLKNLLTKKRFKAIFFQASETSTGAFLPVQKICETIKENSEALIILDAISGLCAHDIKMDEWHIDCMISGSQKGFGVSPGLSFVALSDHAQKNICTRSKFYFDYKKELSKQNEHTTAWTPAITLFQELQRSLQKINAMGIQRLIFQHKHITLAVRNALEVLKFKLLCPHSFSHALTAAYCPEKVNAKKLMDHLQHNFNVTLAGGQDTLKGKIIRFAHLGFVDPFDVISGLSAIELSLKSINKDIDFDLGVSLASFLKDMHKIKK